MKREDGKKRQRKRSLISSPSPAMACPDSLPILIYTYPQGSLCKSFTLTAKKNAKWLSSATGRKIDWYSHSLDTTFPLQVFKHKLLRATGVQNSRRVCLLDFLLYFSILYVHVYLSHLFHLSRITLWKKFFLTWNLKTGKEMLNVLSGQCHLNFQKLGSFAAL